MSQVREARQNQESLEIRRKAHGWHVLVDWTRRVLWGGKPWSTLNASLSNVGLYLNMGRQLKAVAEGRWLNQGQVQNTLREFLPLIIPGLPVWIPQVKFAKYGGEGQSACWSALLTNSLWEAVTFPLSETPKKHGQFSVQKVKYTVSSFRVCLDFVFVLLLAFPHKGWSTF